MDQEINHNAINLTDWQAYFFHPTNFHCIFHDHDIIIKQQHVSYIIPTKQDITTHYQPTTNIERINLQMQHSYRERKKSTKEYTVKHENHQYQRIDCPETVSSLHSNSIKKLAVTFTVDTYFIFNFYVTF